MSQSPRPRPRPVTDTGVADFVDNIISVAIKEGASDIHLGLSHDRGASNPFILRLRLNGRLENVEAPFLRDFYREIIARIKVLSRMDITETAVPQDGQFKASGNGVDYILRVSTIPASGKEELSIRIARYDNPIQSIDNLRMGETMHKNVSSIIRKPSGMLILNGPAGSGKTTTIYAILRTLAGADKKIVTVEDPVEMYIPWVSHTQINHKTDFATMARAFMRQNADVIFVGEIRDPESAGIAVQLAQTGHLVLTTLHTRDSIGVVSRLKAFEILPNMVASTLLGSLAQRLLPQLCDKCRQPYRPSKSQIDAIYKNQPQVAEVLYYTTGGGCKSCRGGISGLIPVFELFAPSKEVSEMINRSCSATEIETKARTQGMKLLEEEVLKLARKGLIPFETVMSYF